MARGAKKAAEAPHALIERVRRALEDTGKPVREVRMFGGLSFMVADKLTVSVGRDDDLLVRVDPDRHQELIEHAGAETAEMGGRTMGPGWVHVTGSALTSDAELGVWLEVALAHHARLTRAQK